MAGNTALGKTALVSGAAGFIGRWSVPQLIRRGYEVHAVLGRSARRDPPQQLRGAELHHADLLDGPAIQALIARVKPSHLLHFAWIATPGLYWRSPDNSRWLAASQQLLRCFRDQGGVRAVMAGSSAEYDWSQAGRCDERTSPLADNGGAALTPYAESKIAMQRALERFGGAHGLSTAWGRIFFQYGPDEHPDRLVASAIVSLLSGREALCTHGRQVRDFLHVADVGSAFAALLDSDVGGAVNIGSGDRYSIAEVLGEIAAQIGRPELVRLGARSVPPSEPLLLVPEVRRLHDELGWQPHFDLQGGIADTIAWWRRALATRAGEIP
ncbi:MAG: NAD(P)-dependent oxidoreductase [Pseudomonadota bacterium]|nr:NAD(P)-dependent oxidoreductase [Pseudomonadota bacterium]